MKIFQFYLNIINKINFNVILNIIIYIMPVSRKSKAKFKSEPVRIIDRYI